MKKKEQGTSAAGIPSGLFQERDRLMGQNSALDIGMVDAALLWAVVVLLASKQASIQIGVTKDGGAWAVQYWDGQYPVKDYFKDTHQLNRSWAGLLRAGYGNNLPPDLEELVKEYGW